MITKPVIIISGATATGKTNTSLLLAKHLINNRNQNVSIVNFDSLLFYKEFNVGTAKPTAEEIQGVEHHMINICSGKKPLNASQYVAQVKPLIKELHQQQKVVILVGGSGFYLRALVKGMYESITTPLDITKKIEKLYNQFGIDHLRNILKKVDSDSFNNLHRNDHYRIKRAVEYYLTTAKKISEEKIIQDKTNPYDLLNQRATDWDILHFYLHIPKALHLEIIAQRTQEMLKRGLIEEVQGLLEAGFSAKEKAMNSIGYKETLEYLSQKLISQKELKEKINISTRQLAKAQKTFFKKIIPKEIIDPTNSLHSILSLSERFLDT